MLRTALALGVIGLAAAPSAASSYSATLATPTTARLIARDIVWNCGPAACQGATDDSRPPVLCQSLAKRAGPVATFIANGRALSAAELERCNASAKAPRSQAVSSR